MLRCGFPDGGRVQQGPLLVVGEAVRTTIPVLSERTAKAIESGRLAADTIHTALDSSNLARLDAYTPRIRGDLARPTPGQREDWRSAGSTTPRSQVQPPARADAQLVSSVSSSIVFHG